MEINTFRWWVAYVNDQKLENGQPSLHAYESKQDAVKDSRDLIRLVQQRYGYGNVKEYRVPLVIQHDDRPDDITVTTDGYDLINPDTGATMAMSRVAPIRLMAK